MRPFDTITLHVGHDEQAEVTPLVRISIELSKKGVALGSKKVYAVRQIYPKLSSQPGETIYTPLLTVLSCRLGELALQPRLKAIA